MTDDLQRLVERIEGATGPDREIDCLIWGTQEGRSLEWQGNILVEKLEGCIGWIDPGEHQRNFGCNRADQGFSGILAYTRSIDAAMTLVPEGFIFGCGSKDATKTAWAWASPDVPLEYRSISNGATPALALCAAALRARINQEQSNDPSSNG